MHERYIELRRCVLRVMSHIYLMDLIHQIFKGKHHVFVI